MIQPMGHTITRQHKLRTAAAALALAALLAGCSQGGTTPSPGYERSLEPSTPVVTLPAGQPFDYQRTYEDKPGRPVDWRVTLLRPSAG